MNHRFTLAVFLCLNLNRRHRPAIVSSSVIISEIAGKGSSNVCGDGNNDWLELHNTDPSGEQPVSLAGYILHDGKGIDDDLAFTFPKDYDSLLPGEYRLICTDDNSTTNKFPQFAIGGNDTLTLISSDGITVVTSVGPMPGTYNDFDTTYAWDSETNAFQYTSTPTPGSPNVMTQVGQTSEEEIKKQHLAQQNDKGTRFFGMDSQGYPVQDSFDQVLDLHMTMEDNEYQSMMENKYSEVNFPFQSARLATARSRIEEDEIVSLTSPGRIRTKGLSSLFMATCMGTTTVPFQIEFNASETLFGVEKMYLRNHFLDPTYMRDWAMNRMLARFGLPYLRARKIRFFINQDYIGFYTAVEAVDQEYVFARSFPNYNPFNYALYKWKADAIGCGRYDPDVLADAEARLDDFKPPYSFEPGPHRPTPPVYGKAGFPLCLEAFADFHFKEERADQAALYLMYDNNCGEMLVEEGLMDRDLGTENWDSGMKDFINQYLTQTVVDDQSEMDQDVDLESFLKTIAVYAVMLSQDSVLGNPNNYYLAQTGDENDKGYKLVSYDHNMGPGTSACDCGPNIISWSIARPTCGALELNPVVGPLLLKPELHARYIEHVRDFVEGVASASDLLDEIHNHARSIYPYVGQDFFNVGGNFQVQLSTDPEDWNHSFRYPLVPFLLARVQDIREQLKAMEEGTFHRGPHQPVKEAPFEECVDWHTIKAPEVECYNNCLYEGCYKDYWRIDHQCIAETGTCIHGTYDIECRGIPEGQQYDGMESPRESTGLDTFCIDPHGVFPIKASICPPPPASSNDMFNFDHDKARMKNA